MPRKNRDSDPQLSPEQRKAQARKKMRDARLGKPSPFEKHTQTNQARAAISATLRDHYDTDLFKEAAVELFDKGMTNARDVATRVGVDPRTIRRYWEDTGRRLPEKRGKVDDLTIRAGVFAAQAEGLSNREIGRKLGLDRRTVRKILKTDT